MVSDKKEDPIPVLPPDAETAQDGPGQFHSRLFVVAANGLAQVVEQDREDQDPLFFKTLERVDEGDESGITAGPEVLIARRICSSTVYRW